MVKTTIEIPLILFAFFIGYYTKHVREMYHTLQPNILERARWWAVLRGTFTKRTAPPLIVMFFLLCAVIGLNIWDMHSQNIIEINKETDLIKAINQAVDRNIAEHNTGLIEITENNNEQHDQQIQDLIDRIDKLIATLEAQNATTTE